MEEAITGLRGARTGDRAGEPRYRPIRDYAAIGDCHGAALVGRDGAIDWCALRRFDAEPVFCRLLDADRGGFWSIRPTGDYRVARSYLPDTNILRTVFATADGEVALTDFMPVGQPARRRAARLHEPQRARLAGAPDRGPARRRRADRALPALARLRASADRARAG